MLAITDLQWQLKVYKKGIHCKVSVVIITLLWLLFFGNFQILQCFYPLKRNMTRIESLHTIGFSRFFSWKENLKCSSAVSTDRCPFSHLFLTAKLDCLDQGRTSSSWPASAIWSPPWPRCGRRAAWRWGSQGRRGRPAKPSTPVSAAPLSTWED